MMDRIEVLPNIICPVCGYTICVHQKVEKLPKGKSFNSGDRTEKTYIVDCGNESCDDYRKIKFLKAQYIECEYHWID